MPRILLLMATRSYRSKAFMQAARRQKVQVIVGSEHRTALASKTRNTTLALDFKHPARAVERIVEFARDYPLSAVIGVDDDTTVLAAMAADGLGLPHNSIDAVRSSRDKFTTRGRLATGGLPSPWYQQLSIQAEPEQAAGQAPYPCVLKPVGLSASRGVIRADNPSEFVTAFRRIIRMLGTEGTEDQHILVESFVAGPEVAVEGLLTDGALSVLALFDKPDPLDGPYFEETLYVTPSRLSPSWQAAIARTTSEAAAALGLRTGPIHAELRLNADPACVCTGEERPYVVEIAARSIGGLCSNVLRFGTGLSLEELIIRHAIGSDPESLQREQTAGGVMMLPIPRAGRLWQVLGKDDALRVPGVDDVDITIPIGQTVAPLPEGDRYLGFVFARGDTPGAVEAALRQAHERLRFDIREDGEAGGDETCLPARPAARLPMIVGV